MVEIPISDWLYKSQISDEDFDFVNKWLWNYIHTKKRIYAVRSARIEGKWVSIYLHKEIAKRMGLDSSQRVDHKDCNSLNNQRNNLRIATNSQNVANSNRRVNNSSGFKGVRWNEETGKYTAEIKCQGRAYYLGSFKHIEDAARAYDEAAIRFFKEFANLNFPT